MITTTFLLFMGFFASMDDAALDGLREAKWCSMNHRECGGAVYVLPDGRFTRSGNLSGDMRSVGLGPALAPGLYPPAWHLVASWHVHTCEPGTDGRDHYAEYFSDADVNLYAVFWIQGYMLDLCTGTVHVFDPFVDKAGDAEDPRESVGHVRGFIDPRFSPVEPHPAEFMPGPVRLPRASQ